MDHTKQQTMSRVFLIIGTAWLFDAMDVGLLSFIMSIVHKEWALTNSQTGLISSISTVGMVCGGFYFGHLADRIGRKNTLIATLLTFSIGNLVLAGSPGFYTFLAIRFVVGMGLGGELPVAATYIADIYRGSKRSQMLILADSFWAVGWLVASFLSFLLTPVLGWRGILIVTAITGFFAIILRKHIHESHPETAQAQNWLVSLRTTFKPWTLMLWLAWFMVMFLVTTGCSCGCQVSWWTKGTESSIVLATPQSLLLPNFRATSVRHGSLNASRLNTFLRCTCWEPRWAPSCLVNQ